MTARDTLVRALEDARSALMAYDHDDAGYPFRTVLVEQTVLYPAILMRVKSDPATRKSGYGWTATWDDGSQIFYRSLADFRNDFSGHTGPLKEVYRP